MATSPPTDRHRLLLRTLLCALLGGGCAPERLPTGLRSGAARRDIEQPVIVGASMEYYQVSGSSFADLRQQLDQHGPLGFDGYRGDAATHWSVSWDWPGSGSAECDLAQADVSYHITVVFPQWDPPPSASPQLRERWSRYLTSLAAHEAGHVQHLIEHHGEIADAIADATCLDADAAAEHALERLRRFDRHYDQTTGHGASQGAVFP